jgi:hypothetical protein
VPVPVPVPENRTERARAWARARSRPRGCLYRKHAFSRGLLVWCLLASLLSCRPADPLPPELGHDAFDDPQLAMASEPPQQDETLPHPPRPPRTIYRSEIDRALRGGPGYLLRQLGPEPFRHGGRFVGWELTRVFPDDPDLCAPVCDIEVGDVILAVAGDRLETPQALSQLLERLSKLEALEVQSLRHGKRRVVTYGLVEDR